MRPVDADWNTGRTHVMTGPSAGLCVRECSVPFLNGLILPLKNPMIWEAGLPDASATLRGEKCSVQIKIDTRAQACYTKQVVRISNP